jgi:hypothetical protein
MQKGREVFLRVQELRELNGLVANAVSPFPTTEITPGNVKAIVDKIANDLKELRDEYDIEVPYATAALPTGKTPNDVYLHLQQVNESLNGFYLPAVVPNDVYQVASTIVNELILIREQKNITTALESHTPTSGKSPGNVFELAEKILHTLKSNCDANSAFCPKGGIVIPPSPQGSITPANVLDILNNILAEIGSIKVHADISVPINLAPTVSGKTPSGVFDQLLAAQSLADSIK